jgi:thymidylate kinase
MCVETEFSLSEASRAQLVRHPILPTIEKNTRDICDRFFDSSTADERAACERPEEMVYR